MLTAVLAAIASAIGFAVANPIQHQAAGAAPPGERGPVGLMVHLVQRPAWVIGTSVGLASFVLHGVAVHAGPLAVVQPIATSGMVFAVLGRPLLDKVWPTRREMAAAGITAVGLTVFVIAARPREGTTHHESTTALLFTVAVTVCATGLAIAAGHSRGPNGRGLLMGCATGLLFGTLAGVLKLTAAILADHGLVAVVTHWPLYGLLGIGIGGMILNQHAYQQSPLSVTMPVLNVVDVLVAVGFGYLVFDEIPAHHLTAIVAQVVALTLMAGGVRELTRAPGGSFLGAAKQVPSA